MALDAAFKEKWVKALRSGRYVQGRNAMLSWTSNRYCCLGVACRILGVSKAALRDPHRDQLYHEKFVDVGLSRSVAKRLVSMNDGRGHIGMTYLEVADYIEKRLGPKKKAKRK